jgi:hypothetical protein
MPSKRSQRPAKSSCRSRGRSKRRLLGATLVLDALATVVARLRGYKLGGNVTVRCRRGHLFTTIWIPGASLKSVRLGWYRLQRCPVGGHWSLVSPVREADLSEDEPRGAAEHRDLRIP